MQVIHRKKVDSIGRIELGFSCGIINERVAIIAGMIADHVVLDAFHRDAEAEAGQTIG